MGIKNFFSGLFRKNENEEEKEILYQDVREDKKESSELDTKKADLDEKKEELSFSKEISTEEVTSNREIIEDFIEEDISGVEISEENIKTDEKVESILYDNAEYDENDLEFKTEIQELEENEQDEEKPEEEKKLGFFARLKEGLKKTGDNISSKLDEVLTPNAKIDDDLYDELEEILITSDISFDTSIKIIERLRNKIEEEHIKDASLIKEKMKEVMYDIFKENDNSLKVDGKSLILITGVNGVGKTTTIGKLAMHMKRDGKSVLLVAGDTFRAAAAQQLEEWSKRADVPIQMKAEGSDPSSVIYDGIQRAKKENYDVVIVDTAGRLHNKKNLMMELEKIHRVITTEYSDANLEILLVIDASTGQNAMSQVKAFSESIPLTGVIMTKLDGTAKGGVILSVREEFNLPIKYIGVGEKIDDLQTFDSKSFVDAIIV